MVIKLDIKPDLYQKKKSPGGNSSAPCIIGIFLNMFPFGLGHSIHNNNPILAKMNNMEQYINNLQIIWGNMRDATASNRATLSMLHDAKQEKFSKQQRHMHFLSAEYPEEEDYLHSAPNKVALLHALEPEKKDTSKLPCYTALHHNPCKKGNGCPYNHDPAVLRAARDATIRQLNKSDYSNTLLLKRPSTSINNNNERDNYKRNDFHAMNQQAYNNNNAGDVYYDVDDDEDDNKQEHSN